jgi:hypothetical protein
MQNRVRKRSASAVLRFHELEARDTALGRGGATGVSSSRVTRSADPLKHVQQGLARAASEADLLVGINSDVLELLAKLSVVG